jgi:hypothetical protein
MLIQGRPRKAVGIGTLPALAANAPAPPATDRPSRIAQRNYAGTLRAMVDGVELVGELPAARGVTRHRLRLRLSSGPPIAANLNRSPDAGAWITIEVPGLTQAIADRLAEAALLRLRASCPALAASFP